MSLALLFDLSARDRLRIEGPDAASFLNRLLTIDALRMPVGCGARPFLLEPTGRIVACFHLLRTGDEAFLAECTGGHGADVLGRLDMYHFGERIEFEAAETRTVLSLQGDGATAVLQASGVTPPAEPWDHHEVELDDVAVRVARVDRVGTPGYDVWCAVEDAAAVGDALRARGATDGDAADLERMRVEGGVPDHPAEYGAHSSPLEVSGVSGVTEGKGCYPGQEVVERTLALGRPPRRLVRLALDGEVGVGATLRSADVAAGVVTSVVGHTALALVKRRLEDDVVLEAGGGVHARIVS